MPNFSPFLFGSIIFYLLHLSSSQFPGFGDGQMVDSATCPGVECFQPGADQKCNATQAPNTPDQCCPTYSCGDGSNQMQMTSSSFSSSSGNSPPSPSGFGWQGQGQGQGQSQPSSSSQQFGYNNMGNYGQMPAYGQMSGYGQMPSYGQTAWQPQTQSQTGMQGFQYPQGQANSGFAQPAQPALPAQPTQPAQPAFQQAHSAAQATAPATQTQTKSGRNTVQKSGNLQAAYPNYNGGQSWYPQTFG